MRDLTGTTKFKLDLATRDQLKTFVNNGGTLIVDAAGGSADFASSAETELATIFGADARSQLTSPLPDNAPVFALPGSEIHAFQYRTFLRKTLGSMKGNQLRAISINNRPAVFYSRYDLVPPD